MLAPTRKAFSKQQTLLSPLKESSKQQSLLSPEKESLSKLFAGSLAMARPRDITSARKQEACKPQVVKRQTLLPVAHRCRDCGQTLSHAEDALHRCTTALAWPFASEQVAAASSSSPGARLATSASSGAAGSRIIRLSANCFRGAAGVRLREIWEHVREGDLSHALELPTAEAVASKTAWLLLALRGKEVLGLLSAERVGPTTCCELRESIDGGRPEVQPAKRPRVDTQPAASKDDSVLGVALIWVRRSERRRGLASTLVDAARRLESQSRSTCAGGQAREGAVKVAFSQPTELGKAFATKYALAKARGASDSSEPLVYQPKEAGA